MLSLNKIMIIGNITRDPELTTLNSGAKKCVLNVATSFNYKKTDGSKAETVEYHICVVFGKLAEVAHKYLLKGDQVFINGRKQTRSWEDKQNHEKKFITEIVVETLQFGAKSKNRPERGQEVETSGFATVPGENNQEASNFQSGEQSQNDLGLDYGPAIDPQDIPF